MKEFTSESERSSCKYLFIGQLMSEGFRIMHFFFLRIENNLNFVKIETLYIKHIWVQQQLMTTVLEQDHCSSDFLCTQLTLKTTILAVVMLSTAVLETWPSGPDELFGGMEP